MNPLHTRNSRREVWGIPVDLDWWRSQDSNEIDRLRRGFDVWHHRGPHWFATMVAAALEEVGFWIENGVQVDNRRWVDVGGNDGYYAIALRLFGAASVTLLDTDPPSDWALPVLEAAGVNVVIGDATEVGVEGADSACLLYVPGAEAEDVIEHHPELQQLVMDAWDLGAWPDIVGWTVEEINDNDRFFVVTEDGAGIAKQQTNRNHLLFLHGSQIPRPLPPMFRMDECPDDLADDPPDFNNDQDPYEEDIPF